MNEILANQGVIVTICTVVVFFVGLYWMLKGLRESQERSSAAICAAVAELRSTLREHREHDRAEHKSLMDAMLEDRKQVVGDHQDMTKMMARQNEILVRVQSQLEAHIHDRSAK